MGMTWKLKVIRLVFAVAIVAALAMALAANFADISTDDLTLLAL
jgi:hypothetical protein